MKQKALLLLLPALLTACTSWHAGTGAPESVQFELTNIPRNDSLPDHVFFVEPLRFDEAEIKAGRITIDRYAQPREMLDSMLISSLAGVGNFRIFDRELVARRGSDKLTDRPMAGPYLLRTEITELNGTATIDEGGFNPMPERGDGLAITFLKLPLFIVAYWTSMLTTLPTSYEWKEIVGVVAMDVELVDVKSHRVLCAFPVRASHMVSSEEIGRRFGAGWYSISAAESALEQALRVAFRDVAVRLAAELSISGDTKLPSSGS